MGKKVELTFHELSVLNAFGHMPEASIPKLAVEARLTPTEMKVVISSLTRRSLILAIKDGNFARLTPFGASARANFLLANNNKPVNRPFGPSPSSNSPNTETEMKRENGK